MGKSSSSDSLEEEDEKKNHSSSDNEESDSEGSNTSDDEEKSSKEEKGVKKKRIKKEKKGKKDKKKHKSKEEKKKKKKKKSKKHKKKKDGKNFGKYGLITLTDLSGKREEFSAWLLDIKKINLENISHVQEKKLFEEFIEDYNTATFPSKKYYDLHNWELKQKKKLALGELKSANESTEAFIFNDEMNRSKEIKDIKIGYRNQKTTNALQALYNYSGMHKDMAEQQNLQNLMTHYYKIGNFKEANAIKKMLEPKKKVGEQN